MSRFASEAAALVVALWVAAPAPAAAAEPAPMESSFRHRMIQGRFLLDAGRKADALREFEAAAEMDEGRRDADVHGLVAKVRLDLGRVAGAVDAVRTARALSGARRSPELDELHEFLTTRFGKVLVIGRGTDGAHAPEPIHAIVDPELKRLFGIALKDLERGGPDGSTSIYLPVGSYRVGTHIVSVAARKTARMDVRATVGSAGGGVYGERAGADASSGAPSADPAVGPIVRFGGLGLLQQGAGAGGGRLVIGAEVDVGVSGPGLGLRVAADLGFHRIETVVGRGGVEPVFGVAPSVSFAGGPILDLPGGRVSVLPWLVGVVGYGGPIEATLPDGYEGPLRYFLYGADGELRLRVHPDPTVPVHPEFVLWGMYREALPTGSAEGDPRPHGSVGGGVGFGLWIAP